MYNQGNFPFGQRLPPPPPPPFQQGPAAPQHPIGHQGSSSVPPAVGQPGPPAYGHASSAPPAPVPPGGMLNSGQSYLFRPPQMLGSTPMPSYSTSQQNFQWPQGGHHIQPHIPPPLVHHPYPRMLPPPPPPPQGQAFYRGSVHPPPPPPPPPQGGVANFQHGPLPPLPPPPPSNSQFFMSSPGVSFTQSAHESAISLLPPPPPPPPPPPASPPPMPPPLPPSSPPHTSPIPSSAPIFATASDPSMSSTKPSDFELMASDVVGRASDPHPSNDDGLKYNSDGFTESKVSSPPKQCVLSDGSLKPDLPLPPPRPAEEDIARKIEVLCHYIGKNGDKFEAMTRQKEFGNPEFKFLFGGEPGSEAAVAHEYFLWMKKKCSLACKLHDDSSLRPSVSGSSFQLDGVTDAVVSHSSVDSDMDMEDDITQPDEAQVICKSVGSANQGSVLNSNELDMTESPHANYAEHTSGEDVTCTNLISTGSLGVVEQGENDCDYFKNLSAKGGESVVECTSNSNSERFNSSPHENLKKSSPLAATGGSSVKVTSELRKGASPFRLLQDYASDDSSENVDDLCVEDVSRATASLSTGAGARSSDGYPTNLGFKDFPELNKEVGPASVSVTTSSLGILSQSPEPSTEVEGVERKIDKSVGSEMAEQLEDSYGRYEVLDAGTSHKASQEKDHLGHGDVDASGSAKLRKEEMRSNSNQLEVDEFGRLHRAGASDSDSDELHYKRRRGKRDRSRSRSRSPQDRRRRSPLRRREKLSRSPSWSPRNRRSRSRSPSYRRGGEAGVDRSRRERGQLPDCFDFLRGKCFRGTSCRYFHDSEKAEESRQHKSKQYYQDFSRSLKSSGKSVHQHDETNRQEMHYQDFPGSAADAMKDADVKQDAILVGKGASDRRLPSEKGSVSLVTNVAGHEIAQRLTSQEQETGDTQEGPVEPANNLAETATSLENNFLFTDSDGKKLVSDISERTSSFGHLTDQLSQASPFIPVLQTYDYQSLQTKDSSTSVPAASTFPSQLPVNEPQDSQQTSLVQSDPDAGPLSNTHLAEYMTSQELRPNIPAHLPHPQLPVPPVSQGPNPPIPPQLFSDYNNMPSAAKYPSHSASGENFIPYQTSMAYQHSHFSIPPASSWSFLPPPPPHPPHGVSSSQFPQNQLLPRNDHSSSSFPRPYATDMPTHSQVGEFHHGRHPVQEHDRRLSQTEDLRPRTFPIDYSMTQQFGGSSLTGEDTTRPPVQGLIPSNPFAHGNIHPRPVFSRESPTRRMQSLPSDILPPGELPTPSSESHRHFPPYSLQGPAADNFSVTRADSGNIHSGYSSEFLDKNLPSHLSDFGRSRITNHYNPYASTFDQPLSTKFSSNIPTQENDASYNNKYSGRSNLSHAPADGQGVSTLSSRIMTSSPNSARDVAETLPRPGGDQYDPIFDSFEPSSSSLRRNDNIIKREATDNIDIMLRFNPSNKPQDPAENNMQKEAGAVAVSISAENDEFGETADGEVGAVENGSPSDPVDSEDLATGDIEIEQVKTPGKIKKKSKDSRSMKLFKVALADFVKEVLKPSWRQGNMSKEAFKTIVKKTVEKVSGAMKSHHIPKSQAKINHYIDSSQRKLTKLVMGYVDKYVKS